MQPTNLGQALSRHPYPGRGIVFGRSADGNHAYIAYFIMGRSENSRNRVFTQKDGGIVTEAANPAKMQDPSLVIYAPVRKLERRTIVTNGDQTDTVYDCLAAGVSFEEALRARTFEPDAPNFTPRISGLLTLDWDGFTYQLSILRSANGDAASVQRFFYDYPQARAGEGHLIHTYAGGQMRAEGQGLASFSGEPVCVSVEGSLAQFGETIWNNLNEENKVSLFVRSISLEDTEDSILYNKYSKV